MTKKLLGLFFGALFSMATLNATVVSCTQSGGGNPATFTTGGSQAVLSDSIFTCPAFTIPAGDTLTSVSLQISNSFSQATVGQTNTIDFTYTISGFDAVTALTTSSSSNAGSGDMGGATDFGGIVSQAPGGATGCTNGGSPLLTDCSEITPVTTSFTVTGSSSWQTAGPSLTSGGSDGFNVTEIYTYSAPSTVPEPASLMMIGGGLVGLAMLVRKRKV